MAVIYTAGDWHIAEGNEDAFIEAWAEFADWSIQNVPGSSFAKLTRDVEDPQRFLSFGPWSGTDAIEAWRAHPAWAEKVEGLRALAESVTLRALEVVSEVGAPTPDPE